MRGHFIQAQYWNLIVELNVDIRYLQNYALTKDFWEKWINISVAVTSSSGIGAWVIWKPYVGGILLGVSQLITALRPYFPFKIHQKAAIAYREQLKTILLSVEASWFGVANGEYTAEEIHDLITKYRAQIHKADKEYLKGIILPPDQKLMTKAETEAELVLRLHYPQGETHERPEEHRPYDSERRAIASADQVASPDATGCATEAVTTEAVTTPSKG